MRTEDEAKRQADGGEIAEAPSRSPVVAPIRKEKTDRRNDGQPQRPVRRYVLIGIGGILALAALYFGYEWLTVGRYLVSTEDAYVHVDFSIIAPKVTGYVASVPVAENQPVKAGEPLVVLDGGDYQLALDSAEARIASQRATLERLDRQVASSEASVEQAKAQKISADADVEQAQADYARYETLAASDYASRQRLETSKAARDRAVAAQRQAVAGITAAEADSDVVRAQKAEAQQGLRELEFARDRAQRDLDGATLRAPVDGVVGNLAVAVGDYVTPGKRLLAVVPLKEIYIDANFKETQIADLKPGTPVKIEIDAYPDREIRGEVAGVAPASGAVFSLLPPENATGNFTKIVQRVPVRVRVPEDVAAEGMLRPGLSVVVTADPHGVLPQENN
ncbi:hemolysin D [Agaricicola taiwanensis]|uniref:Hemolysin D n=1 Tax=Agaricicola taiwanensis TaxID=591372 RepID=A0A8J2VMV2_9RHOB|nr:HlyD family secretion protein [Agaricicola taiwanensis]GGE33878.1 hemolysin D [Agaricicola taiwanensis]